MKYLYVYAFMLCPKLPNGKGKKRFWLSNYKIVCYTFTCYNITIMPMYSDSHEHEVFKYMECYGYLLRTGGEERLRN